MLITIVTLAISTILNAVYFMRALIILYEPSKKEYPVKAYRDVRMIAALICFMITNLVLGMHSDAIVDLLKAGLKAFG
jgi:multicomponent Na+:H+ antiporter subunit D